MRKSQPYSVDRRSPLSLIALGALPLLAGCSADIARFDFNTASLSENGSSGPPRPRSNLMGTSARDDFGTAARDSGYSSGRSSGGVERSDLTPPPSSESEVARPYPNQAGQRQQPAYQPREQANQRRDQAAAQPRERIAALPPNEPAPAAEAAPVVASGEGETIVVQRGDTLYGISRKHSVSVVELEQLNNLSGPSLKPGQSLRLPPKRQTVSTTRRLYQRGVNYETASETPAQAAPPQAEASAAPTVEATAPADWTGSYTVKQGDSLYAVSRRYRVPLAELERNNGVSNSRNVKPGTTLKVPASDSEVTATAPASNAESQVAATPSVAADSAQPTMINTERQAPSNAPPREERVARLDQPNVATDASPSEAPASRAPSGQSAPATAGGKLRWPVTGRIVSGFGPRSDGTHNDGVNVLAPMGTDVHAAESGVVAYAGDELKGYGNLVLVRHDNGWVTAYAHADELLVKRGDRVKRGQVVAKAGRSGQVDQPQVHFELRQGQRPVDPTPFMDRM